MLSRKHSETLLDFDENVNLMDKISGTFLNDNDHFDQTKPHFKLIALLCYTPPILSEVSLFRNKMVRKFCEKPNFGQILVEQLEAKKFQNSDDILSILRMIYSFIIFDETAENDEKTPTKIDSGIWRGYRLLYLEKAVPKLELLDQAINYIHDDIPQTPHLPVLDQMPDKNEKQIIFSAPNWEISAISINAGDNQDNQVNISNSIANNLSITGPNTIDSLNFLDLAQSKDKKESLYELLQNKKVDVNVADSKGYTALMIASTLSFDPELVDFLIDHGANVNQTLKDPNTPFHSLKICLSIYYHNFRIRHILNRIIDVGEKILPVIKDKRYANDGSRLQKQSRLSREARRRCAPTRRAAARDLPTRRARYSRHRRRSKARLRLETLGGRVAVAAHLLPLLLSLRQPRSEGA